MVIYSPTVTGSITSDGSSFSTLCATTSISTTACVTGLSISGCAVCVGAAGLLTAYTAGGGGTSPMVAGTGTCSIVGNCTLNTAAANYSFVGGGCCNKTCLGLGSFGTSAVVGGCFNQACNDFSFIGSGQCNTTLGQNSFIGGGCLNVVCGINSWVGGGASNQNFACCNSGIIGGTCNNTCCNTTYSFIGIGNNNCIQSPSNFYGLSAFNTILSGCNNCIYCNCYNLITAGAGNSIACNNPSGCAWNYNTIVNGCNGIICGAYGFIGNSTACNLSFYYTTTNAICSNTYGGTILNGTNNCVFSGFGTTCFGTILGGCNNVTMCNFGLAFGQGACSCNNFTTVIGCNIAGFTGCTMFVNNMCVCGTLSKVAGSFRIPHPDPSKPTKDLIHSFVESPTAGENIYRYSITTSGCAATIALPEYYSFLNCDDQVFVTPKNHVGASYGIVNEAQTCVTFCSNVDGDYNVLIIGTRKDQHATDYWKGA